MRTTGRHGETGLDLVRHERYTRVVAERSGSRQEPLFWHDHAALALDGLDEEADRAVADGGSERFGIPRRESSGSLA